MNEKRFHLEPEDEDEGRTRRTVPLPSDDDLRLPLEEEEGEKKVDVRTVAERQGRAVEPVAGARPPPAGWPLEALRFPLRESGGVQVLVAASVLVVVDLVMRWQPFAGLLLHLPVLFVLLRWQFFVAGRSAAGEDAPPRWGASLDLTREGFGPLARWTAGAALAALALVLVKGAASTAVFVVFAIVGSILVAALSTGLVVEHPGLVGLARRFAGAASRPLGLLVGALGWWAWVGATLLAFSGRPSGVLGALLVQAAVRLAGVYLWLLSARAIGVVAREG